MQLMYLSSRLIYPFLLVALSALADPSTNDDDRDSISSTIWGNLTGLTGDSQCSDVLCVSAVVNGSTVQYILQSTGSSTLGWMAMGFGSQMENSPMVIMWTNSDGSVTLSQRITPASVEPSVDPSPPRVAALLSNLTSTSGSTPRFGYSISKNSDTTQSIIWALSDTNPGDSSESATLKVHKAAGVFSLDLTKSLTSTADSSSTGSSSSSAPLTRIHKLIIAHAVLLGVAFLIFLPSGALLARWMRTFSPGWFNGHWQIQFPLTVVLIVVGFALGVAAVSDAGGRHFNNEHQRWGITLFVFYFAQCTLGAIIHYLKPALKEGSHHRPLQNYAHAVFGLFIIALSFYQVRLGYKDEWPRLGRGDAPDAVNASWIAWLVIVAVSYAAGLSLLPRQYRLETGSQTASRAGWDCLKRT